MTIFRKFQSNAATPSRLGGHALIVLLLALLCSSAAPALAQENVPALPLPEEAEQAPLAPSAHLFLRELSTRQQDWFNSHRGYAMLANLFPAVLEQEGVIYNVEANGEWLLQNGLLVFQVLDDYRQDYDVLAWEQDRTWSVNSSGEIGSRGREEMDAMARELLSLVAGSQDYAYEQTHSYFSLADLTRNNSLPASNFRPIYTSLGYQVARPAQGLLLIHRAGKESGVQRNLWYGAVAFGGSCAWLQESGKRLRVLPYLSSGTDGLERILSSALHSLVAAQNRYRGAYQHYGKLEDLSGLYYERLDFSEAQPRSSSGIVYSFVLNEDQQGYTVAVELSGRRMFTDQTGEIGTQMQAENGGELYLPLPGLSAETGFVPDEETLAAPAEGLDESLRKARVDLITTVLNHVHIAEEAHLLRHGAYGSLLSLQEDGLMEFDVASENGPAAKDGVDLRLTLAEDAGTYQLEGQAGEVLRLINEKGVISEGSV
jgi:hypothetical protein